MASPGANSAGSLSLEELLALSDEIAVLVRAGIPLEAGLGRLAEDLPGRLAQCTQSLAARLERGLSVPDALRTMPEQFPPVYIALVETGARSGRLGTALEAMAVTGRRIAELRQIAITALLYPFLIALVGYALLGMYVYRLLPRLISFFAELRFAPPAWMTWLARVESLDVRWWIVPLAVMFSAAAWWWYRSAKAEMIAGRGGWTLLWLPPARRMLVYSRWASLAELLAVMVEHEVPLDQAVRLAAQSSGDPILRESAQLLADRLERGDSLTADETQMPGLPPLLWWSLVGKDRRSSLLSSLRFAAGHYRRRALDRAQWLRTYVPVLAALILGGVIVVVLLTALVEPWAMILHELLRTKVH